MLVFSAGHGEKSDYIRTGVTQRVWNCLGFYNPLKIHIALDSMIKKLLPRSNAAKLFQIQFYYLNSILLITFLHLLKCFWKNIEYSCFHTKTLNLQVVLYCVVASIHCIIVKFVQKHEPCTRG